MKGANGYGSGSKPGVDDEMTVPRLTRLSCDMSRVTFYLCHRLGHPFLSLMPSFLHLEFADDLKCSMRPPLTRPPSLSLSSSCHSYLVPLPIDFVSSPLKDVNDKNWQ